MNGLILQGYVAIVISRSDIDSSQNQLIHLPLIYQLIPPNFAKP